MKKTTFTFVLTLVSAFVFGQTWSLDKAHSRLGFDITHLLISEVEGSFQLFDAQITASKDDFSDARIQLTVDAASINTDNDQRDNHLKSPDFFDAAKYSTLTFQSKSLTKVADKKYKLAGDLTMHGITKPVEFDVTFNGTAIHPMTGKTIAGFKVTGIVNRSDFGVGTSFAAAMLGEDVAVTATVELIKEDSATKVTGSK